MKNYPTDLPTDFDGDCVDGKVLEKTIKPDSGYLTFSTLTAGEVKPMCTVFVNAERKICIKSADPYISRIVEIDPKTQGSDTLVIGRTSSFLPEGFFSKISGFVSRSHFALKFKIDKETGEFSFQISDLSSSNGTFVKEQASMPWNKDDTVKMGPVNPENIEESEYVKVLGPGEKLKLPRRLSGTKCRYSITDHSSKSPFPFADVHPADYGLLVYSEDGGSFSYPFGQNIFLPNEEISTEIPGGIMAKVRKAVGSMVQKIKLPNPVPAIVFNKNEQDANSLTIQNLSDRRLIVTIIPDGRSR